MGLLFLTMFGGIGLTGIVLKFFKGGSFDGIALVNGVELSRSLFQKAVAQEDRQLSLIRQQYGKNADLYMKIMGISNDPQLNALQRLIQAELVDQCARGLNIHIASEYVEARLADPRFLYQEVGELLPQEVFTQDGRLDIYKSLQFLKETGQMPLIEKQLKEKLVKQFAVLMLQSAFFVPSYMIRNMYIEQTVAKKFSYQTFSLETFLAAEKSKGATDQELKAFYNEQNKLSRRYWTVEQRDASLWSFTPEDFGITVQEDELKAYYSKNRSTRFIKEPLQIKVREIVFGDAEEKGVKFLAETAAQVQAQLEKNPALFESLAKEYSSNKKTASKGGVVDFFKRGTYEKEYEKAAFKLKEDGEISPVIPIEKGFVILQRVAKKDAVFESFDAVKATIEKSLLEQKFKSDFSRQVNQLSRQEDPQTALAQFVSAHHGVKTTMKKVKKETENLIEQRLFILKNEGEFQGVIVDSKGIIVQLDARTKAEAAPFETVKAQVAQDLHEERATKALEGAVKQAKKLVLKNGQFVAVDGGKISSTQFIKLSDEKAVKALADLGFPQECFALDCEGAVLSSFSLKNGIVIRLDALEKIDDADFTLERPAALKSAFERNNAVFSQAFIASLFRTATIKVNDSISRVKD